jgi:uncharacterized protein
LRLQPETMQHLCLPRLVCSEGRLGRRRTPKVAARHETLEHGYLGVRFHLHPRASKAEGHQGETRYPTHSMTSLGAWSEAMKLTDESRGTTNMVRSYAPGELRVGEASYTRSCVLAAQNIVPDWPPQSIEELQAEHLDAVLALQPEVVILGTGVRQQFPPAALMSRVLTRGVGLEVMDTAAACRTFNILIAEDRKAVAALLL